MIQTESEEIILLKDVYSTNNGNFLTLENLKELNLNPSEKFSITFWLKSNSIHRGAILAKMVHDMKEYRGWDVSLYNEDGKPRIGFHLNHQYPENCIKIVSTQISNLCNNHWHHVTVVYNGHSRESSVKMFIDNKQVDTKAEMNSLAGDTRNDHPITIGSRFGGMFCFQGNVYDVRIIKKKLSQFEILKIIKESKSEILNEFDLSKFDTTAEQKVLIRVKDLSRTFKIHHERPVDIFEKLTSWVSGKNKYEKLVALKNISFEVKRGEMLGILGRNGSGKTTLLKILGKIIRPSTGVVDVYGKILSFLSLGATFHPDLTAKQNVILYGMILGETKHKMEKKADSIIQFAELEHFADVKMRNFSTGMNMRLAVATALSLEPEILLIDEVLAVGDISFQQKSLDAFLRMKNSGKAIVFVSHNLQQLEKFCDKLILIENGKILDVGEPEDVILTYRKLMQN